MKIKIAAFVTVGNPESKNPCIFDHQPHGAGWIRVTEWVEVYLPEVSPEDRISNTQNAVNSERAELQAKIAKLDRVPA